MMYLKHMFLVICIIAFFINVCSSQNKKNEQSSLNDRIIELNKLLLKKSAIRLNAAKYKNLVKGTPRNYSMIIMMTAMSSHRQCQVCRAAHDEFLIVANSWRYSSSFNSQLYFAIVDFDDATEIFQQLNINSAPVFLHIPPSSFRSMDTMDIQRVGFSAETIAKWIFEKTEIQIRVIRPPSYLGIFLVFIFFVFLCPFLYLKRDNLEFLYNRTSWCIISLFIVFLMTSGQMWNHIRAPPIMQKTHKGNSYIHSSTNGQYVIETYIVIVYNVSIVIGMILMNEAMKNRGDPKRKKVFIIIGLILTSIFFSALISIFRMKAHGYPYSFLFK